MDQVHKWNAQAIVSWLALGISIIALGVAISAHVEDDKPASPHG